MVIRSEDVNFTPKRGQEETRVSGDPRPEAPKPQVQAQAEAPPLPVVPGEGHELSLEEYMLLSQETARYPDQGKGSVLALSYVFLKMNGEAGEIAEKFGKILRDKGGRGSAEDRDALILELGDVLWYVAAAANELDVSLEDVARRNLGKLYSRHERGKISGSGDNR